MTDRKRSGLTTKKTTDIEGRLAYKVDSILQESVVGMKTHDEIRSRISSEVYDTKDFQKLPFHSQSYIEGRYSGMIRLMYVTVLEWRHSLDGRLLNDTEIDRIARREYTAIVAGNRSSEEPRARQRIDIERGRWVYRNDGGKVF